MSDVTVNPRCLNCGKPMRYNVPRLGPDGGYVHVETGDLSCNADDQAFAHPRIPVESIRKYNEQAGASLAPQSSRSQET